MKADSTILSKALVGLFLLFFAHFISICSNIPLYLIAIHVPTSLGQITIVSLSVVVVILLIGILYCLYAFKFRFPKFKIKNFLWALVFAIGLVLANTEFSIINQLLTGSVPLNNAILETYNKGTAKIFLVITVVILGPFLEELVYRGLIQRWLHEAIFVKCRWNDFISVFLSSCFFASVHASQNLTGYLVYFVIGLFLGVLFNIFGDLRLNVIVHSINNLIAVFV